MWSAFNGFGLALVIPCIASLTADYHPAETRGRAFGLMALTSGLGTCCLVHCTVWCRSCCCISTLNKTGNREQGFCSLERSNQGLCVPGGMFGGFFATNLGHFRFGALEGWRLAFHLVALVSLLCSLLVLKLATDPRKKVVLH